MICPALDVDERSQCVRVPRVERDDGARTHSTVSRQVTHVAADARRFLDGMRPAGRGESVITDSRSDSGLSQQNNGREENEKSTNRTFSGHLPAPTSPEFNSYLDCKNPNIVPKLGEVPAIFRSYGSTGR